jgi:hypothetical protein
MPAPWTSGEFVRLKGGVNRSHSFAAGDSILKGPSHGGGAANYQFVAEFDVHESEITDSLDPLPFSDPHELVRNHDITFDSHDPGAVVQVKTNKHYVIRLYHVANSPTPL